MAEGGNRNQGLRRGRAARGLRAGIGIIHDDDDWDDEAIGQFPVQARDWRQHQVRDERRDERPFGNQGDRGQGQYRGGFGGGRGGHGHGGGRGGGAGRRDKPLVVGFKLLENLKTREPSNIVLTLSNPQTGLRDALLQSVQKQDMVSPLLNVLALGFTCNSQPEQLNRILVIIREAKFFDTAMTYFLDITSEDRPIKLRQYKQPITDMITIMGEIMNKNPTTVTEFLGIHTVLNMVIDDLRERTTVVDEELLTKFREFTDHKEELLRKRTRRRLGPDVPPNNGDNADAAEPPDDFRDIHIFPQTADMQMDADDRYLRANKTKGKYEDVDHYLDVQFRLLREDFVAPLREGISEYIEVVQEHGKKKRKPQNVRIYNNVKLISPETGDNGLCHVIQFDVSRMGKVNWHSSKRLIFGSLVCLSRDNFRSFLIATVVNRDVKKLQQGLIVVRFQQNVHAVNELFGFQFTMAETTAYFESYKHVLTGLQHMRQGDLPFERYIIQCENQVNAPAYLRRRQGTNYDLRPLVDEHMVLKDKSRLEMLLGLIEERVRPFEFSDHSAPAKEVKVLDRTTWPPADLIHCDESQFRAVYTALTKEFVITQGPPGTGKTYIGLKIVKALLHNKEVWSKHPDTGVPDNRPMLVVCYTNHALDQFLEGIVSFYKGDVLRVGGRSQSEILKPYGLHNFRMRFRHEKKIPVQVFQGRREAKNEMDYCSAEIQKVSAKIQIASTCIMHEEFLRPHMSEKQYLLLTQQFEMMLQIYPEARQVFGRGHSVIVEWLGLGNLAPIVEMEGNMAPVHVAQAMPQGPDPDNELIDVEDEIDAIQAQRQLDDGEDDASDSDDDEIERLIGEFAELGELTRKQRIELKVKLAESEQQKAVALNIDQLTEKPKHIHDGEWQQQKKQKKKMKQKVQRSLTATTVMTDEEADAVNDMWRMTLEDKWRLYRLWLQKHCDYLRGEIREKEEDFETAAARYREALLQEDKEIMRHSTIIGMTTTGAAKYQAVLQEIRPRIIVVEEAAEVLEAHIITTLSRGCEHLILIGDHKQLKPNPTVYKLATHYNLDVSLFERMVNNGVQCDTLELQHRMRPEIAELMIPIYPDLKNHEHVLEYEPIRGISSNIFFINHGFQERNDEDLRSHSNEHEAAYVVGLCKYLLLQGYKPEQITVLTLYSGQLFCLKGMMPKEQFEGVRVTVVDNYQGQENDIVLLSLVRSNEDNNPGFLKIDNRVCVALSRAKKGFYVIGNFEMLKQTKSDLWKEVVVDMKAKNRLGDGLKLICQNHPDDDPLIVKLPKDFSKAPEGGCQKKCGYRLDCGHRCEMYCHVKDMNHEEYVCRKRCDKVICGNGHKCKGLCSKKCQPCKEFMQKTIPQCGHVQPVPCSVSPEDFTCQEGCKVILGCGHKCQSKCGMAHTQDCAIPVEKTWPCGHKGTIKCYQRYMALCPQPCDMILDCEHRCKGTCGKCLQGRLHRACKHECNRILVCGHRCIDNCSQCPPCKQKCENKCQHSRCHKRCGEPCAPCKEPCSWRCEHHQCQKLCYEPCDRPRCDLPCRKRLTCGHMCIGVCGEPCPTDCRICDKEKVTQVFFGEEDEPDARFVKLEDCRTRCIVEVKAMDYYMDTTPDVRGEIKLKECPKCKTPIRTSTRYRAIINKSLQDIEAVKRNVLTNRRRIRDLEDKIKEGLINIPNIVRRVLLKKRLTNMQDPKSENALAALQNQVTFAKHICQLIDDWKELNGVAFEGEKERGLRNLDNFMDWVLEERSIITPQETTDAEQEIARSRAFLKLLMFQVKARERKVVFDVALKAKVTKSEKMLTGFGKYDDRMKITVENCLADLKRVVPLTTLGISEDEKVMVVNAMQLPKGHWFKCPKGHVYAIADCGGATVEGRCPECQERIGGAGHRLREDNRLAGEMDGAQHAAWSEQANLGNYGFDVQF